MLKVQYGLASLKMQYGLASLKVQYGLASLKVLYGLASLKVQYGLASLEVQYCIFKSEPVFPFHSSICIAVGLSVNKPGSCETVHNVTHCSSNPRLVCLCVQVLQSIVFTHRIVVAFSSLASIFGGYLTVHSLPVLFKKKKKIKWRLACAH